MGVGNKSELFLGLFIFTLKLGMAFTLKSKVGRRESSLYIFYSKRLNLNLKKIHKEGAEIRNPEVVEAWTRREENIQQSEG